MGQTGRVNRGKGISDVDQAEQETSVLVSPKKGSSGAKNARHFGQKQILLCIGGDVVQHREADSSAETPVREWQANGISLNHLNVCSHCPAR